MVDTYDRMVDTYDRMVDTYDRMVDTYDRMVDTYDRMVDTYDCMLKDHEGNSCSHFVYKHTYRNKSNNDCSECMNRICNYY